MQTYDRQRHPRPGAFVMSFNSLLCSVLAAYACGASGTYEKPRCER